MQHVRNLQNKHQPSIPDQRQSHFSNPNSPRMGNLPRYKYMLSLGVILNHLLLFPFKKRNKAFANFFSMSFLPVIPATGGVTRGWKAAPIFSLSYLSVINSRTALPLAARSVLLAFRTNFYGSNEQQKTGVGRVRVPSWREILKETI